LVPRVIEHAVAPRLWVFLLDTSCTNLADLAGLPIEGLIVEGCDIKSLDPIVGMPLKYLWISNVPVTHLPNLRGDPANLNQSTKQQSFPPLRFVNLPNTRIADISELEGLPIEFVNLTGTLVSSLEPLRSAELMWISFWGTGVSDTSPLVEMSVYTHPEHSGGEAWRKGD